MLRKWAGDSARIVEVSGADHFLEGKLEELERVLTEFLDELRMASKP
jgi:alpha/beta superfamily hydrolase